MGIEPIPPGEGRVNQARVVCDDCGRSEVVACKYERRANMALVPMERQAIAKATAHGWALVKNRLLCPTCERKRKMAAATTKASASAVVTPIREPDKAQKRLILMALEDAYDAAAERYKGQATDRSIAEELGAGIMPGWVSALRDEFFGPAGNEEVAAIKAELEKRLEACVSAHDKRVRA